MGPRNKERPYNIFGGGERFVLNKDGKSYVEIDGGAVILAERVPELLASGCLVDDATVGRHFRYEDS